MKPITTWLEARLPDSPTPDLCSLTPVAAKVITESKESKESQTLGRNGLDGEGTGKVQEAQEEQEAQESTRTGPLIPLMALREQRLCFPRDDARPPRSAW